MGQFRPTSLKDLPKMFNRDTEEARQRLEDIYTQDEIDGSSMTVNPDIQYRRKRILSRATHTTKRVHIEEFVNACRYLAGQTTRVFPLSTQHQNILSLIRNNREVPEKYQSVVNNNFELIQQVAQLKPKELKAKYTVQSNNIEQSIQEKETQSMTQYSGILDDYKRTKTRKNTTNGMKRFTEWLNSWLDPNVEDKQWNYSYASALNHYAKNGAIRDTLSYPESIRLVLRKPRYLNILNNIKVDFNNRTITIDNDNDALSEELVPLSLRRSKEAQTAFESWLDEIIDYKQVITKQNRNYAMFITTYKNKPTAEYLPNYVVNAFKKPKYATIAKDFYHSKSRLIKDTIEHEDVVKFFHLVANFTDTHLENAYLTEDMIVKSANHQDVSLYEQSYENNKMTIEDSKLHTNNNIKQAVSKPSVSEPVQSKPTEEFKVPDTLTMLIKLAKQAGATEVTIKL